VFPIPAGDGTNQTRLEGFLTNCGCVGPAADEVSNDETLDSPPHEALLIFHHCNNLSILLHSRFPTQFIRNVLDFVFPTRGGPVSLCLIACAHSVGEEAELGYQLQLRRNRVCMITI